MSQRKPTKAEIQRDTDIKARANQRVLDAIREHGIKSDPRGMPAFDEVAQRLAEDSVRRPSDTNRANAQRSRFNAERRAIQRALKQNPGGKNSVIIAAMPPAFTAGLTKKQHKNLGDRIDRMRKRLARSTG